MISLITLLLQLAILAVHALPPTPEATPTTAAPMVPGEATPPVLVVSKATPRAFRTVNEALDTVNKYIGGSSRVVIRVESGEYDETVVVTRPHITLVGDGIGKSVITGNLSDAAGLLRTYQTATFSVDTPATGFVARGMTFRNTYGEGSPAVAFQSSADNTVLYKCSLEGFQDTLDVLGGRHFYKDCQIHGAVDFIFGYGSAVFQNCALLLRNSSTIFITAQGRYFLKDTTSGFVFHECDVRAGPELKPVPGEAVRVYLGRPWGNYAMVVFLKTYLDEHINPTGWSPWGTNKALPDTVYFGEYLNHGPGSDLSGRARWPGLHLLATDTQASEFSVGRFLLGDGDWLSSLGVPFNSTL